MNLIFDDNKLHHALAPLTLTRPVAELRIGIETISESWIRLLSKHTLLSEVGYHTQNYLHSKFKKVSGPGLRIAGNIKPSAELAKIVANLVEGESLHVNNKWVATNGDTATKETKINISPESFICIEKPWDIFQNNGQAIELDFTEIRSGKTTQQLSQSNRVIGNGEIFIEAGAKVEGVIFNTEKGPIHIGKNAEIMEGAVIRGPFALGEGSVIKMAAKIYGDTTIGKFCKVGGEISNTVFQSYSNKGHDGFVGNSVIGEWCNLGADTNTSNLKNNYSAVRVYSYESLRMEETGITFCGVIMGDHVKTSINTMLNTATSVGVCSNIFGSGFPPKYVPSFSWGAIQSNDRFKLDKAYEVAENMMKRRSVELTDADKKIMAHLYKQLA